MCAIQSWGDITFVLSRKPFDPDEIEKFNKFCKVMNFDPLITPDGTVVSSTEYNLVQNYSFYEELNKIISSDSEFFKSYIYKIDPVSDDKPYFSRFVKFRNVFKMIELYKERKISFVEIGLLMLLLTVSALFLISVVFIILPLFFTGILGSYKFTTFIYFAGIGSGFMFAEMTIISYLEVFLDNPAYSAPMVISSMLLFSGAGSFLSGRVNKNKYVLYIVFLMVVILLFSYSYIMPFAIKILLEQSYYTKILSGSLLAGSPAFFMGFAFPCGISLLREKSPTLIPWAWSINSFLSVITPPIAILISMEMGFSFVMMLASLCYLLPFGASFIYLKNVS